MNLSGALQTYGIAKQHGEDIDAIDETRRQNSTRTAMLEAAYRQQKVYEDIVRAAYQHHGMGDKVGLPAAAPVAPVAAPMIGVDAQRPMPGRSTGAGGPIVDPNQVQSYANGGMVRGLGKFDGIYDDAKRKDRSLHGLPTLHKAVIHLANGEHPSDPQFHGKVAMRHHAKKMANGGMVRGYENGGNITSAPGGGGMPGSAPPGGAPFPGFSDGGPIQMGGALGAPSTAPPGGAPFPGYMNGNTVRGPGSGTSDSVPAMINGKQPAALSDGEMVIPRDVVKAKGSEFFDKLIAQYHTEVQNGGA